MEDKKENVNNSQKDNKEEDVFETAEIKIEEMAIDGICGVY
jgi:mycofactocin precursor